MLRLNYFARGSQVPLWGMLSRAEALHFCFVGTYLGCPSTHVVGFREPNTQSAVFGTDKPYYLGISGSKNGCIMGSPLKLRSLFESPKWGV